MHGDDVTELGSKQAYVPYFGRKEHCSRGLKSGRAWAWILRTVGTITQNVVPEFFFNFGYL